MSKFSIEKLKASLAKVSPRDVQGVTEDLNLFTHGYLDSLLLMKFILALEADFGLSFDLLHVQLDNFKNLSALKSLLEREYSQLHD